MFVTISGPMASGKSFEIIRFANGYIAQGKDVQLVKPNIDTRNDGIWSRAGLRLEALSVDSLGEVPEADVYVVDEAHFFDKDDVKYIERWLDKSDVIISGLDVGHQRELMPFYTALYELKPDLIIQKVAQCQVCNHYNAQYTQILKGGEEVTANLTEPPVEDGTYEYQARCRRCFVR